MPKVIIAIIEQTVRKQVAVPEHMTVGKFSPDALNIVNALNESDHSTIISQKFLSAEIVEVSNDET